MDYQIISQDRTVTVKISNGEIVETLSMTEPPSDTSMLVQQSKKDVLGEINSEKMLLNLNHCVDLLQITFNAVDGFSVQSKVQVLENQFIDAMNKSNATALGFKLACNGVVSAYMNAYEIFFEGETETAVMFLINTKDIATQMVKKADELVAVYDKLTLYTNVVLTEVMNERSTDEQKRTETNALIKELEDSVKAMEMLKENLRKDIAQFEADYKKLQEREMKREGEQDMQLTSLIIDSLNSLFSIMQEMPKNADALSEHADAIGKSRGALQEQERATIVKLSERIAKMQNAVMNTNPLESAIQCLVIARGCLRRVLAYLQEMKLFWMNVEIFCDNLASNDNLKTMISMQENESDEQRAACFKTELFVKNYVGVVAKWQALCVISTEYIVGLSKASKRMSATFEQTLSADRKEQWKFATQLAGHLKEQIDLELEHIE